MGLKGGFSLNNGTKASFSLPVSFFFFYSVADELLETDPLPSSSGEGDGRGAVYG